MNAQNIGKETGVGCPEATNLMLKSEILTTPLDLSKHSDIRTLENVSGVITDIPLDLTSKSNCEEFPIDVSLPEVAVTKSSCCACSCPNAKEMENI